MPEPKHPLKVFLCHARDDKVKTRELYRNLRKRGIQPWLDAEDLVAGQDWRVEIPKAIKASDAIIICLSKNSINKEGFVQAEITFALEKALEVPQGRIFIIPARFEDCEVPENLERFHYVDLFEENGFPRLMKSLKTRAGQLERSTVQVPQPDEASPNLTSLSEEKIESQVSEKVSHEKAKREVDEKARLEAEEQARQIAAREEERIRKEAIAKRRLPSYETLPSEKPAPEKSKPENLQPKKTISSRKPNTTIIVALIGLAGTIITALLSSPTIEKWFSPATVATEAATATFALTSHPVTPLNGTPTEIFSPIISLSPIPSAKGSGKIAFVSNRDGEIYVMNSDGSNRIRLTQSSGSSGFPQWSPDGMKIAYISIDNDEPNLYIMDFDGGNQTLLVQSVLNGSGAFSWSPDGEKIAFVSYDEGIKSYGISVATVDGFSLIKLTNHLDGIERDVTWSPDGNKIAFTRNDNTYIINSDGSNELKVMGAEFGEGIKWSPDSQSLLFYSGRDSFLDIYMVNVNTFDLVQLTNNQNYDYYGTWSPNGTKIAFVSTRSQGAHEIFLMDSDGKEVTQLTNFSDNKVSLRDINWSPDGTKIVFTYKWSESFSIFYEHIYVIDIKSKELINLSSSQDSHEVSPVWAP